MTDENEQTEVDDAVGFREDVCSETNTYVTSDDFGIVRILVPARESTREIHTLAHANDMTCVCSNVLDTEQFDVELIFDHVSQTDLTIDGGEE